MKRLLRRTNAALVLLAAFLVGLGFLLVSYAVDGSRWALDAANRHLYENGRLMTTGTVVDRDGTVLAASTADGRVYAEGAATRRALLHLVGDSEGFIAGSVQKVYGPQLAGYSHVGGIHTLKEYGLSGQVRLTVSAALCRTALEQLDGRKGAVCVYDYTTGEVLCSVSSPTYDPQNKPDIDLTQDRWKGVYVNRVLQGLYPPGSTFKLVVAAAALEHIPDIRTRTFTCEGRLPLHDGTVVCNDTHGTLTFEQALAKSCNSVFAQIALELGPEPLAAQAEKMGFGRSWQSDGFTFAGGQVKLDGATAAQLGWAGIGQHTDMASPLNMMCIAGAVAAGGRSVMPRFVQAATTPWGLPAAVRLWTDRRTMMEPETAAALDGMMRQAAVHSFGEEFLGDFGLRCKTGTAEVESGRPHAWLVGYLADERLPLAFAVVIENGGSAAAATRPVVRAVLRAAAEQRGV